MGAGRSVEIPSADGEGLEEKEDLGLDSSTQAGTAEDSSLCEEGWCFIENSLLVELPDSSGRPHGPLDEESFCNFAPLLAASQEYASLSGCRFRGDSFACLSGSEPKEVESAERQEARHLAEPKVREFADRLLAQEPVLLEEMERAFQMVMNESVRNAMVAAFREVDLWPPEPRPDGVEDNDCSYEDLTAPVPVIAQRAWNDEAKRRTEAEDGSSTGSQFRRAATASYLVDFAHEVGIALPVAESHMAILSEFGFRMEAWSQEQSKEEFQGADSEHSLRTCTSEASTAESVEEKDAKGCDDSQKAEEAPWADSFSGVAWTLASAVFIGAAATAGIALVRHGISEEQTNGECHEEFDAVPDKSAESTVTAA